MKLVELGVLDVLPANDNVRGGEVPVVRKLRRGSRATYARSLNILLPLSFARLMPGWGAVRAARGRD